MKIFKAVFPAVCMLVVSVVLYSAAAWQYLNFDSAVSQYERVVPIVPSVGERWAHMQGGVNVASPLAGRYVMVWEQPGSGCDGRVEERVVLQRVDLSAIYTRLELQGVRLRDSSLCIGVQGLQDGELIQLFVRLKVEVSK